MRDIAIERRAVLRLLVGGAVVGWGFGAAAAHRKKRRRSRRLPVIAIDAGHGGSDPGAISPHGIYEKRITLAVAREFARQLSATRRFHPFLIRRHDVFVPLHVRVARARAHHADAFVSLHADILPDPAMRGLLVFTLSQKASDREAAAFARRENGVDHIAGVDLSRQSHDVGNILLDLERRHTSNRSIALARAVVAELGREVPLLEKPRRSADFAVLTAPDIPSVLVELGCLSNRKEERLLHQRRYQRRLAHGLVRAVEDYWRSGARI
jgi:N-acetylmuramoyl-L-alanine amidase